MVSRFTAALLAALAVSFCLPVIAADGEFRIGVGVALNNNVPVREEVHSEGQYRGQLYDASAVWHDVLRSADAQLAWTYIAESDFGTEQAVSLTFIAGYKFQFGGGLILGYTQAYETWQREYKDPVPVVGPRQCIFCGISIQAAYEYKHAQLQLRYWRTDFNLYPGHNGAIALITWRL